ncbi:ATP-binding protein [Butyricimonas faecalis]|jgi:hypothetical protein|uniref:DUF87 domain-containing protein n=1 Tax=Butyricimonas faecalis TaxID=2093856 RepID=A0A3Q9IWM2_9BACT|nr:DUF87 domain-containing protein [Butyricimonas faecalis]AZS31647.1 DUF87 domain-containing protein [Butyricimonas faecalis]
MKIGKIISVEYDKFRVRLFHTTRNSTVNIDGKVYYFGNIGSYLKTLNSSGEYVLCEVVSIVDWVGKENQFYSTYNLDSSREIIIKPIGTLMHEKFCMGVGIFPSLYTDVEIVTFNDLDLILSYNDGCAIDGVHSTIFIGTSKSLINYSIELDVNRFFNIHSAVLGNSGSGKSNTIAHILHEVYRKHDNEAFGAKTIIFDANGEYPMAFGEEANLHKTIIPVFYKPNISKAVDGYKPFVLPYYLMNLDEWLSFLMASERTQKPFWDRVLQESYKFYSIFNTDKRKDAHRFANYIKWKLRQMLFNIVSRIDSDTSKMTAAKGAVAMLRQTCNSSLGDDVDKNVLTDLSNFLNACNDLCVINFGNNNDSLSNALNLFTAIEDEPKYVCITKHRDHCEANLSDYIIEGAFRQIDESDALAVDQNKLKPGKYFDYHYLRTAVDMVLLEEEAHGNLHIRDFTSTLMSRLDFFLYNPECAFMRIETPDYLDCNDYLEKMFGISDSEEKSKQLITIDSSEVGTDALELMTSVVSRMVFDYRKCKFGKLRQQKPIHLILDEAHRYIRKDANYIMRENIFEKIAREGRKYSLYLIISSQRPSELSQTVLSQCGNYIVHRIQNEVDMKYIYSVLPYFSEDYITKIKQAVPGEALIFGNCVPMPIMVKIKEAKPAPNSKNCDIKMEWFYKEIITDTTI